MKLFFKSSTKFFIVSIRMMGRGEPDQAKIASLIEQLSAKLDVYDKILAKQPYLAGQVN
jgi:glutathione S-transferase